ncbi:hypothetical protein OS175_00050 [Marinicella sp. S1101]|uniref:hypothetical protein n=1 Tax=Marinicella marina TaxID=2996016 RepID=UPI002260C90E|nr:hypothetical protein [Marinicella marina]MCX7552253.1 hypothetical protein [Marinicella marina]MDJ1139129.1 hypothetical protein [Marinicella marina]
MKKYQFLHVSFIWLFVFYSAHAAVSDFEISVDQTQFSDLNLGEVGQFSITLTNHGPDVGGNGRPLSALASSAV